MKVLFLLPPSEGKENGGNYLEEKLSFNFEKPCNIANNVSEKDLKCTGERYLEGLFLNKSLCEGEQKKFLEAINRYTGVMYSNISYKNMSLKGQKFFNDNFIIFSGMYGMLRPLDIIGNYKLPLGKSDLYKYWWDLIPNEIIKIKPDYIINLLPINYAKLIGLGTNCNRHKKKLNKLLEAGIKIININFIKEDGKKIAHGVKKIKGEWIYNICENNIFDYKKFGGEIFYSDNIIDINIKK